MKIHEDINRNAMERVAEAIIEQAVLLKKNNDMSKTDIKIKAHYSDNSIELVQDGKNFYVELWIRHYEEVVYGSRWKEDRLKCIHFAFWDEDAAHLFGRVLYAKFYNTFGEFSYRFLDDHCGKVFISYGSGFYQRSNPFFEKFGLEDDYSTGVVLICCGINPENFVDMEGQKQMVKILESSQWSS